MKKFYLIPYKEITPQENRLILTAHNGQEEIIIQTTLSPEMLRDFLGRLRDGLTNNQLKTLSKDGFDYAGLAQRLQHYQVVFYGETVPHKTETTDYLTLLKQAIVGPGRIMSRSELLSIPRSNPFHDQIYLSRSLGFESRFIDYQPSLSEGLGADSDPRLAEIKAIVEGVERYALADYHLKNLESLSWQEAQGQALTPQQLNTSEDKIHSVHQLYWERYTSLTDNQSVLAPIDFSYHPVDYDELGRGPICPMNISGVAAHQSISAATTNAILELCEHEALMLAWYGNRVTPTISPTSVSYLDQRYITYFNQMGWQVILKDISLDLAPVVMAIGLGPAGKRALTIGSCAAFSLKYAVSKALSEVVRTVLTDEINPQPFMQISEKQVDDTFTHSEFYAHRHHLHLAEHLWNERKTIDAIDTLTHGSYRGQRLDSVLERWQKESDPESSEMNYLVNEVLGSAQLQIFVKALTPKTIEQSDLPLYVVRALIPEMARLAVGYGQIPAQTNRFKKLLTHYGDGNIHHTSVPHPFS